MRVVGAIGRLGSVCEGLVADCGRFSRFVGQTFLWIALGIGKARNWGLLLPQCFLAGAMSVPVIMVTGAFIGMVLAVQTAAQFQRAGLEDQLGMVINLSVVRELGPVLAGVMLAGRVGGTLTAELGTMNVTEQIEALRSMGTDPIRYLVVPRFLACLLVTPLLTLYADLLGVAAGWIVSTKIFGISSGPFWFYSARAIENWDIGIGLFKSLFFGGAIALIACYKGFTCRLGAEGVGRACNESFVASFMAILILDFFLGVLLKATYEYQFGFKVLV